MPRTISVRKLARNCFSRTPVACHKLLEVRFELRVLRVDLVRLGQKAMLKMLIVIMQQLYIGWMLISPDFSRPSQKDTPGNTRAKPQPHFPRGEKSKAVKGSQNSFMDL